ncbi:hypothetical protein JTB14_001706 [Gonioctena quinquepunctata]|nr:hypothetical protein JTB14_001706 [Gonioctena quinquepunctata]
MLFSSLFCEKDNLKADKLSSELNEFLDKENIPRSKLTVPAKWVSQSDHPIAVADLCVGAPKPVDFDEIGRKIKEFGAKALPVARGACGVLNSFPSSSDYPQNQGFYPQVQPFYPQNQGRGFPQAPNFPAYVPPSQGYPQFGNRFPQYPNLGSGYSPPIQRNPSSNVPTDRDWSTSEQDDLNGVVKPAYIPPYIPPSDDEGLFSAEDDDLNNEIPGGRKIKEFGAKALPVARGACGVLNSFPSSSDYPQNQGFYPQVQPFYPQNQGRGFPQAPNFPAYVPPSQGYPQFGNRFPQYPNLGSGYSPPIQRNPSSNVPTDRDWSTSEQDDLNGVVKPAYIPPYIPPSDDEGLFSAEDDDLNNEIPGVGSKDKRGTNKNFRPTKYKIHPQLF